MKLFGERGCQWQRPEWRARTDRYETLAIGGFADPHHIQPGPGVWAQCGAHERDRQLRAIEQWTALAAIGRHIFGGRKVGADPLQRDADQFTALDPLKAAIPVRKPLRREICQRREHETHQRQRHEGLDQRKAALACPLLCKRSVHFGGPRIKRTVLRSDTAPEGDRT
ncbi:hypothetical protein GALL_534440 [mine drainage metagenome]|uniref:Uncharacterized protein n=1 Tax=mine drainage metagenome TaxID=410659 RepID=A0A1J5P1Q7_9ZZZZ